MNENLDPTGDITHCKCGEKLDPVIINHGHIICQSCAEKEMEKEHPFPKPS